MASLWEQVLGYGHPFSRFRQPSFANMGSRSASYVSLSSSQHGGSLWSPNPSPVVRLSSWPLTAPLDSRARRSCVLLLFALLASCSVGGALMLARKGGSLGGPDQQRGSSRRRQKRGPRVCIIYDAERAEPGLPLALTELLRVLSTSLRADVTALRLDDSTVALPAALTAVDGRLVKWVALPPTQHTYDGSAAAVASYRALEWLRAARPPFDHLVFHASGGGGHYPLLAREQSLALAQTHISVVMLSPRQLVWKRKPGAGASIEELEEDHMQRGVASRADALVAPSVALRFMRQHSWKLPAATAPLDGPEAARAAAAARDEGEDYSDGATDDDTAVDSPPMRLASLLELWRRLPALPKPPPAEQLLRSLQRISDDDSPAAVANRSGDGAGSALDGSDSPLVSVVVVHHERGPLLFQALDSIRRQTVAARHVQAVVVDDGSTSAAALATLERVRRWPEFVSGRWLLLRRPWRYLGAARNEAARHASGKFLYFLDDDNCLKKHALHTLLAAAAATGAHVLTSANEKWKSFQPPPTNDDDPRTERWLPLGDAAAVGIFKNCFGDAASLVRRSTFEQLGGFTEDGGVGHEDWELWARAVLRGYTLRVVPEPLYWYRLGRGSMLAESIGGGVLAQAQRHANHARNIRPYLQRLSGWPEAQDAVRLVQGMYLRGQ